MENSPYKVDFGKWEEWHLSEQDIRDALWTYFNIRGLKVDTSTLRIYGYEPESTIELEHIQGHISVFEAPTLGYSFGVK